MMLSMYQLDYNYNRYLTMIYRHQQYESRLVENMHHEELPFFREAVTLIDNCTKLPKDDRIFLRNRIKQYLRVLKQNKTGESEEEHQMRQIVQIFIEANKKKSLGKIQRGDKAMDWLQIKLRKFVDNAKKQRHRRDVQNFRKGKFIDVRKLLQPSNEKNMQQDNSHAIKAQNNNYSAYEKTNYHLNTNNRQIFAHSSLSRSRQKDPILSSRKKSIQSSRKKSQNSSYAHYSYHHTFDFLKKTKDVPARDTKPFMQPYKAAYNKSKSREVSQSRSFKTNKSLQVNKNWANNNLNRPIAKPFVTSNNYLVKQTSEPSPNVNTKSITQQNSIDRTQIDRLTKLFSQHLNASNQKYPQLQINTSIEPNTNKSISDYSIMQSKQIESIIPLSSHRNNHTLSSHRNDHNQPSNTSFSRYQQSSKKIQEMLDSSKLLFEQFSFNNSAQLKPRTTFMQQQRQLSKRPSQDDLFTPPEFLAECRKLITNSSKKKESQADPFAFDSTTLNQNDYGKKLTFSNVLRESRQKVQHKIGELNQMSIDQVLSQNVSANISTKKPESEVAYRFRNITINTGEELLMELFRREPKVTVDRYQLGEVMSKCSSQIQKVLQKYCDVLIEQLGITPNLFQLQFISLIKYFFSHHKIVNNLQQYYSTFLCSILDMKQLGYISRQNIGQFVQSMEGSQVDANLLSNIHIHLNSVFERCCLIEGGGMLVTRWSLLYLQLIKDQQLDRLKEELSNFDFQIDMEDCQQQNNIDR